MMHTNNMLLYFLALQQSACTKALFVISASMHAQHDPRSIDLQCIDCSTVQAQLLATPNTAHWASTKKKRCARHMRLPMPH